MKLKVMSIEKKAIGEKELPIQFNEEIRPDIIKRAVHAIQSNRRQPYGTSPEAGKRASAIVSKRRRDYKTTYGIGQSRTPRKVMSRRGTRMNWKGAFAPQTVGGRRAHPPKSSKELGKKINKKERRKAIRSAISATIINDIVKERGHIIPNDYPFIIENKFEELDKTKTIEAILEKLGLTEELIRASKKKVRAGKGKARGRKYKRRKGPLLVVSKDCKLMEACSNLPGVDVVAVKNLNAELLAPGTHPGRLTLFTEAAIKILEEKKLFSNN